MQILSDIMSVLLILTLVGLIAVVSTIVIAILKIKNEALRSARRLSGPVKSVKNIITAGKGVYDQEGVRVKRIIKRATITVGAVKETVEHTKVAAEGIRDIDFAALQEHSKELLKIVSVIGTILKAARKHSQEPT
jgi:hypothetical protein